MRINFHAEGHKIKYLQSMSFSIKNYNHITIIFPINNGFFYIYNETLNTFNTHSTALTIFL